MFAVIHTTTKETSMYIAASSSMDHRYQYDLWHLPGLQKSTWFLTAAQNMDINMAIDCSMDLGHQMASGGSMDHGSLSRRLNPENKPFIVLYILLLLIVRMIVVGQHFQG